MADQQTTKLSPRAWAARSSLPVRVRAALPGLRRGGNLPAVEDDLDEAECDHCGAMVEVQAALPSLRGDGYWLFPAK